MLAADIGARRLVVASECSNLIEAIRTGSTRSTFGHTILEIKHLIPKFEEVIFCYERRGSNMEAHNLAKFASCLDPGRHLWLLEPPDTHILPYV